MSDKTQRVERIKTLTDYIIKAINKITSRKIYVIIFLFVVTIVFRIATLLNKGISADEATYLIIGRAIFNGKIYFVDIWDFKPIGIFFIYGIIQRYIFDSIITVRIIGMITIFLSSLLIYHIRLKFGDRKEIAILSGLSYLFMIFIISPVYDLNTEIFFNFFTLFAFLFLLKSKIKINVFVSGLLLGIGFVIKYVVIFDVFILFLFYVFGFFNQQLFKNTLKNLYWSLLAVSGFILPFTLVNVYYWILDVYPEFYKATFETTKIYSERINLLRELMFFGDFNLSIFPVILLFYFSIYYQIKKKGPYLMIGIFAILWFLFDWIPIIMQGKHFAHYFIQAFIPVSIFCSTALEKFKSVWIRLVLILLFVVYVGHSFNKQYMKVKYSGDKIESVLSYLEPKLKNDDIIYTNIQSIYYLLDKEPPTRIVHQSIITDSSHARASNIIIENEIDSIFYNNPVYIILRGNEKNKYFNTKIKTNYNIDTTMNNDIMIYKRK